MKILFFSSAPAVSGVRSGGFIVWAEAFVRMLRKRDHEVFIVSYGDDCLLSDGAVFKEKLTFVPYNSRLAGIDAILFKHIPSIIKAAKKIDAIVKAHNIDVVVASSIHEAGGLFFGRNRCPVIAACHAYYPYELRAWHDGRRKYLRLFGYWLLEQLGSRRAKSIVCPSYWLKDHLNGRLRNNRISVIKNMLRERPSTEEGYSKSTLGIAENAPLVVSYNIMTAPFNRESYAMYLEVVRKVAGIDNEIQFILFGINDAGSLFLSNPPTGLPVRMLGRVKNSFEILRLADIFLHVSLIDTFSLITLEAMSMGLPVVATDRGALGELIGDDKRGLLVECDVDEIAAAVLKLVRDPREAKILGENARGFAAEYEENKIGQRWEEFLMAEIAREVGNVRHLRNLS